MATTNTSTRPVSRRPVNAIRHHIGHITYIRNPQNGGVDALSTNVDALVVGISATGFPVGMAARVFGRHAEVFEQYIAWRQQYSPTLGSVIATQTEDGKYILFVVLKNSLDDKPESGAIVTGLRAINAAIQNGVLPAKSIGFTKIGCGPEQLEWDIISRIFAHELAQFTVKCAVFGIKHDESICVEQNGAIEIWTSTKCVEYTEQMHMQQKATRPVMEIPQVATPEPEEPAKAPKAKRVRKVSKVVDEPCGTFTDMPNDDVAVLEVLD